MKSKIWVLGLLVVGLVVGYSISNFKFFQIKNETDEQVTVMLNQIRQVTKLVTVEGSFSEIYSFNNYWGFNIDGFQKKALVRVNAEVLVGYDLEDMNLEVDRTGKRILLSNISKPEIMSVQKELEYYDLKEGVFNQFDEKDFTNIDKRVDGYIRGVVAESDLYNMADTQLKNILQSMSLIASQSGYIIEWEHEVLDAGPIRD